MLAELRARKVSAIDGGRKEGELEMVRPLELVALCLGSFRLRILRCRDKSVAHGSADTRQRFLRSTQERNRRGSAFRR
ncbi:hypothetical protein D3880_08275 [Pseudomonas cavernae]|uniref:Uncharacterized protein n=1 Tax=Pseudomonas cavernae TaxID=2320867 RepID=A0A385Z110_9PSED|nr:hypothetical protein D3880_08275 [Pseudomonas cavernae]